MSERNSPPNKGPAASESCVELVYVVKLSETTGPLLGGGGFLFIYIYVHIFFSDVFHILFYNGLPPRSHCFLVVALPFAFFGGRWPYNTFSLMYLYIFW